MPHFLIFQIAHQDGPWSMESALNSIVLAILQEKATLVQLVGAKNIMKVVFMSQKTILPSLKSGKLQILHSMGPLSLG